MGFCQKACLAAVFAVGFGLSLLDEARADEWNSWNDPSNLKVAFDRSFEALPLSGSVDNADIPWSETYWPSNRGSIANRWNSPTGGSFKYKSPTREQLMSMGRAQIAELSAAEKYDIFMGRYDYPTRDRAWANSSPHAKPWAGICNGWSPASIFYHEPKAVDKVNPDGIVVPFASSDVKGLMSFFYAFDAKAETNQMGARCFFNAFSGTSNCSDVNAGSFHIVLANFIGLQKKAFVADVDRLKEVWNNPVYKYESKIIGELSVGHGSAPGTVRRVRVSTQMTYTDELEVSRWEPVTGTGDFKSATKDYQYVLEIGSGGQILGGDWESWDRPDFLWTSQKVPFTGVWDSLNAIYEPISSSQ